MRKMALIFLFAATSAFSMSLHANDLPPAVVCAQMEDAGDRLLSGETGDFFFVDVAGGEFPIPSFFIVKPPSRSGKSEIVIRAHPFTADSRAAKLRKASNPCRWSLTAYAGPFETMYEKAGGKEEFQESVETTSQAGKMNVSLMKADGLDVRTVVAWNEEGYIMFFTDKPQRAYWLIRLAAKLGTR